MTAFHLYNNFTTINTTELLSKNFQIYYIEEFSSLNEGGLYTAVSSMDL